MAIEEARRRELWTSLRNTLGDAPADTLMTMLPAQPLPELATREDMAALTATLRAEIRAEGNAVRADLRADFGTLQADFGRLRGEFGELRGEVAAQIGELRAEIARQALMLGLTLGGLMLAMLGTILTLGFAGAFT